MGTDVVRMGVHQRMLRAQAALALLIHFRTHVNRSRRCFDRHLLFSLLLASALAPGLTGDRAAPWNLSPARFLPGWGQEGSNWVEAGLEAAELQVPRLAAVRTWVSARTQRGGSGVTLVTQLSLSRLESLRQQCWLWAGPLSAAVYAPLVGGSVVSGDDAGWADASLETVLLHLQQLVDAVEAEPGGCVLRLQLLSQEHPSAEEAFLRYPINSLRNRALAGASTEGVLLLDVDFLPAAAEVARWQGGAGAAMLHGLLGRRAVLVLPAFHTTQLGDAGAQMALAAAQGGKENVREALEGGQLEVFHVHRTNRTHGPTNTTRWLREDAEYEVQHQWGYEPYIVAPRELVPPYDERFTGFGRNKQIHLAHLASMNVSFWVHPHAFVVHSPHVKSPSYKNARPSGHYRLMAALGEVVRQQIDSGTFHPVTAAQQQRVQQRSPEEVQLQRKFESQLHEELLLQDHLPPGPLLRLFGRRVTPGAQAALRAAAAAAAVTAAASGK